MSIETRVQWISHYSNLTSTLRHGISGASGITPFVVVVGGNYFLPVPECLFFVGLGEGNTSLFF